MRHRVRIRKLGRTSKHYEATRRNMVVSLFRHGRVTTTLAKARSFRPFAEKMITLARKNQHLDAEDPVQQARRVHNIRQAVRYLQDKEIVRRLFDEISPRYVNRPGGYTRIVKLSAPRLGDAAPRAILELVHDGQERKGRLPKASRRRRRRRDRGKSETGPEPTGDGTPPVETTAEDAAATDDAVAREDMAGGEPDSAAGDGSGVGEGLEEEQRETPEAERDKQE
jgi:large subunit ribosomal protein L17